MKIRLHRVNVPFAKKYLLSWIVGKIADSIEGTNYSHGFFEIIDDFNQSYIVDNLYSSRLSQHNLKEIWQYYIPAGVWERDLTEDEFVKCRSLLKNFEGAYYSSWKILTLKFRQWLKIRGNLKGTIFPEIVTHILNALYDTNTAPELVGIKELKSLLGKEWRNVGEDSNT